MLVDIEIPALVGGLPPRCSTLRKTLCSLPLIVEIREIPDGTGKVVFSAQDRLGEFVVAGFGDDCFVRLGPASTDGEARDSVREALDMRLSAGIGIPGNRFDGVPLWPSDLRAGISRWVYLLNVGCVSFSRMSGNGLLPLAIEPGKVRDIDEGDVSKVLSGATRLSERMIVSDGWLWMSYRSLIMSKRDESVEFHDISYLEMCNVRNDCLPMPFGVFGDANRIGSGLSMDVVIKPLVSSTAQAIGPLLDPRGATIDLTQVPSTASDETAFAGALLENRSKAALIELMGKKSRWKKYVVEHFHRAVAVLERPGFDEDRFAEIERVMSELLEAGVIYGYGSLPAFCVIRSALLDWDDRPVSADFAVG